MLSIIRQRVCVSNGCTAGWESAGTTLQLYTQAQRAKAEKELHVCNHSFTTVLSGAEERGVQRCSLAPFLIFSIPADLRSYL